MQEFIYGKAPVYYIDGVPGYKAGEWPGLKSNKFDNTRRIIRPKCQGIIFNENDPVKPYCNRKILEPGPSPEYVFRPCCKMVNPETDRKDKKIGIRCMEQKFTIKNLTSEKKHKFDYMELKQKQQIDQEKSLSDSVFAKNEIKLFGSQGGYLNQRFKNITNRELHYISFKKMADKLIINTEENFFNKNQREREDRKKDIQMVNSLNNWEKKTLNKYCKTEAIPNQSADIIANDNKALINNNTLSNSNDAA